MMLIWACIFMLLHTIDSKPLTTADRNAIAEQCINESHVERETVLNAVKSLIIPDDKLYRDFLFCSYQLQGYQSKSGEMLYDGFREFLAPMYTNEELDSIIGNCKGYKGIDHGATAVLTMKCMLGNMLKVEAIQKLPLDAKQAEAIKKFENS